MGGARTRVLPVSRNRHRVRKRRRIDPRRPARAGRREGFPAVAVPVVRASPVTSLRLVDLSHEIEAGMITYAGLPAPIVSEFLSREESASKYSNGAKFSIGRVEMVANTGTYVDAPFHRFEQGVDVGALPLEKLADLPGIVVDASAAGRTVEAELFDGIELIGRAVLVR